MEKQDEILASRIFRTLLLAGTIQDQWNPDGVPAVENLLALLATHGHTQADFARAMETNAAYVSQIINPVAPLCGLLILSNLQWPGNVISKSLDRRY